MVRGMASKFSKSIVDRGIQWGLQPSTMVRELFGVEPDPWQVDILDAFPYNQKMGMKAPLCVDGEVWTPQGWKRWGDVQAGDAVFADDGSATTVVRRFHVRGAPLFRVTLCDGTSLRATADHLWDVQTSYDRKIGKTRRVTTERLMKMPLHLPRQRIVSLPAYGAAMFPYASLPADPYIFGLWLGDGIANEPRLICPDHAIRRAVIARGQEITESEAVTKRIGLRGWLGALRDTGASTCRSYEKFIPLRYKLSSVQQRLDLLRGLMDSDGTVSKNGQTYLATCSVQLVEDFLWLARSLGYYATKGGPYKINGGENRDSYRVTVSGGECPFLADTSKKARWRKPAAHKGRRFIESVALDGSGDAMCIEVANPSHRFLAGDFIVTHNCKGPGKTCVEAWLAWNFLLTRHNPNIAATSISGDNLKDGLHKEMSKWHAKAPLLQSAFQITNTRIFAKSAERNWWMSFRTWPRTGDAQAQSGTLAGLHEDNVMFVLDEAGDIPPAVLVTAEAALSSCVEGHILIAGNPTSFDGALYYAEQDRRDKGGQWLMFSITGDPDDPKRAPRVSVDYARDMIRRHGRDNPWVLINIFGEFPASSIRSLISIDEVEAAMGRHYREIDIRDSVKVMSIDVARDGADQSVIAKRQGLQMFPLLRYRNLSGLQGASIANREANVFDPDAIMIDATGGFGWSWIEQLQVLGRQALPIGFAEKAHEDGRFYNRRAEMAWRFCDWIKMGGALPGEGTEGAYELKQALIKTTYGFKGDRILLEDKDMIKAKLGFSPDEMDAAMIGHAETVAPRARARRPSYSAVQEWNPFRNPGEVEGGRSNAYANSNWKPW